MIQHEANQVDPLRAFAPTTRGIVGLTDQLLEACGDGEVQFRRVVDKCICRWTENGATQEHPAPLSPAAFRTILARIAALLQRIQTRFCLALWRNRSTRVERGPAESTSDGVHQ